MTITEKHQQLVAALDAVRHDFPALAAKMASGAAAQTLIDQAGVALIAFEHEHKIDEGRALHEHAKLALPQLQQFETMLEHYKSEPLSIDPRTATPDEIEAATEQRSALVVEVRKSVATLSRMRDDIIARRKAIRSEAMAIAERRDELSTYERANWERLYADTRAERATNFVFDKILKPLEPLAA